MVGVVSQEAAGRARQDRAFRSKRPIFMCSVTCLRTSFGPNQVSRAKLGTCSPRRAQRPPSIKSRQCGHLSTDAKGSNASVIVAQRGIQRSRTTWSVCSNALWTALLFAVAFGRQADVKFNAPYSSSNATLENYKSLINRAIVKSFTCEV